MKDRFLSLTKTVIAPVALAIAMVAFSPVAAMAAGHGGGGGHAGGFSGGHGFSGGGHSFSAPARGNFNGGHAFSAPARGFNGGVRGGYYGGGYYGGRGWYGPGFGFGVGVYPSYGYAAPVCNPAGFYDPNGVWQLYPGCAVPPYGY